MVKVKSMQIGDEDEIYIFPDYLQLIDHHEELMKTTAAKTAKKALTTRGKKRNPFITLSAELKKLYIDGDGNAVFNGEMLKEIMDDIPQTYSHTPSDAASTDQSAKPKSLSTLLKDAVIEKFGSKPTNAMAWLNIFETECKWLGILENRYWEVIRLDLENSAVDWYQTTRMTFKNASWDRWRSSFLDAFAQKGWSNARSAISFRYILGSLSEYALRKENLLVNFNPIMDDDTKIALIVVNLPVSIQERLSLIHISEPTRPY